MKQTRRNKDAQNPSASENAVELTQVVQTTAEINLSPTTSKRIQVHHVKIETEDIKLENQERKNSKSSEITNVENLRIEKRTLPANNVPEKIIFCLDCCQDENSTTFDCPSGEKLYTLPVFKNAIKVFLSNKNFINVHHQYALVVLNANNAEWICDFTYFPEDIYKHLEHVKECESEDSFDLNKIFEVVSEHITIPVPKDNTVSPEYVVRMILLYNRSYTEPKFENSVDANCLLQSPFFTLDIILSHENFDDTNAEKVCNVLKQLDKRSYSYMFAVERSYVRLFKSMAKLLGHPLQRPPRNAFANA